MSEGQNKPYPLRLEPELKQWVKSKSRAADRSFNAEVNRMLRKLKESEETEEVQKQKA